MTEAKFSDAVDLAGIVHPPCEIHGPSIATRILKGAELLMGDTPFLSRQNLHSYTPLGCV